MPTADELREMAASGMTRKQMAELLCVTPSKVDHHLRMHNIKTLGKDRSLQITSGIVPVTRLMPSQKAIRLSSPWRMV